MSLALTSIHQGFTEWAPRRETCENALERQVNTLLGSLPMAVIYSGNKQSSGAVIHETGNTRSWKSYEAVACDIAGALSRIGATKVSTMPEDMNLGSRLRDGGIQFAWLNSGGVQGKSSTAHGPSTLEMLGIPYVGHAPLAAATLDDKTAFKRHMNSIGIPTAPFVTWHPSQGKLDLARHSHFRQAFQGWTGSFVVKPVNGRASLNVYYVERAQDVGAVAQAVSDVTNNTVLIEGYLGGREFCVAVCGPVTAAGGRLHRHAAPFVFACVERMLDPGERIFTSMDHRPITTARVRLLDRKAEPHVVANLERLARQLYNEMPLDTLIRLDVRADEDGRMFVLEANPKPDLTAREGLTTSIIGEGLEAVGMTYDDLILSLLADRVDNLLSRHCGTATHLLSLIGERA